MSSLKKSLCLQTVYQVIDTCVPLITAPYLARVLGAEKLGIFSFTQSIANIFALFAMLGLVNYGSRTIAAAKDIDSRSRMFWSIYGLQIFTSLITLTGYLGYIKFLAQDNLLITIIQGIMILSCLLNISWLFWGTGNFQVTVSCNTFVKVLSVIFILLFVKTPSDLWIYTFIMAGSTLFNQGILWMKAFSIVEFRIVSLKDIFQHLKPSLVLFVPLAAMSIYHIMDKTMLGALSTYEQLGYYYNTDKVINIPAGILGGIGTVMLPEISRLLKQGNVKRADDLFCKSLDGTILIASALTFGIISVAKEFVPVFFGDGYDECVILIDILSPVLLIKGVSFSMRYQYLIPRQLDNIYVFSVILGAIVNLLANLILIPRYEAAGAIIGTLVAELSACLFQINCVRKRINFKMSILNSLAYIICGVVMFMGIRLCSRYIVSLFSFITSLIIEVTLGSCIYVLSCVVYWKLTNQLYMVNEFLFLRKVK